MLGCKYIFDSIEFALAVNPRPVQEVRTLLTSARRFGLSAAISTPFNADFTPDHARLLAHARKIIDGGCDSITLFGTTGEGASLSDDERRAALNLFRRSGYDFRKNVIVTTVASAVGDVVAQAREAYELSARAVMITPPFYFKAVADEALFAWYAAVFKGLGAAARDVIVYHLPSVTQTPLSIALIGRLKTEFPHAILGVKDSSGDADHTRRLLEAHRDLVILVGDERQLGAAMRNGACGAISGLANIAPALMLRLIHSGEEQTQVHDIVNALVSLPVMAAVKAVIAHQTGHAGWAVMRPPLSPLDSAQKKRIVSAYEAILMAPA